MPYVRHERFCSLDKLHTDRCKGFTARVNHQITLLSTLYVRSDAHWLVACNLKKGAYDWSLLLQKLPRHVGVNLDILRSYVVSDGRIYYYSCSLMTEWKLTTDLRTYYLEQQSLKKSQSRGHTSTQEQPQPLFALVVTV